LPYEFENGGKKLIVNNRIALSGQALHAAGFPARTIVRPGPAGTGYIHIGM